MPGATGEVGIYPGPERDGGSGLQASSPRLLLAYSPPLGSEQPAVVGRVQHCPAVVEEKGLWPTVNRGP